MLRGLAVVLVQLVITPPFALFAIVWHLLRPRDEMIPRVGRAWSRVILRAGGVRLRILGREHALAARPCVVVGNHTSHADSYVAAIAVPQPVRFVAKQSLFRIPLFGHSLRAAGFIPVQRAGGQGDVERLQRLRSELARGVVVIFFPEGTRSRDGRLRPFRKGAFVTAIQAGVPVVPMVIRGAHRAHPAGSIRFRPGTIEAEFLPPIPTGGLTFEDRNDLVASALAAFEAALPAEQRGAPAGSAP